MSRTESFINRKVFFRLLAHYHTFHRKQFFVSENFAIIQALSSSSLQLKEQLIHKYIFNSLSLIFLTLIAMRVFAANNFCTEKILTNWLLVQDYFVFYDFFDVVRPFFYFSSYC